MKRMAINIKLIRLFTGEDVLADLVETNDKFIRVKNPVRVVVVPSKDETQPGIALAPFTHWSKDKEIDIYIHVVMCVMEPITEFKNQYNAVFGGLVMTDNKLIIPGA
jgi:hypothetical protein